MSGVHTVLSRLTNFRENILSFSSGQMKLSVISECPCLKIMFYVK